MTYQGLTQAWREARERAGNKKNNAATFKTGAFQATWDNEHLSLLSSLLCVCAPAAHMRSPLRGYRRFFAALCARKTSPPASASHSTALPSIFFVLSHFVSLDTIFRDGANAVDC